jgi:hypothetical protein
MARILTPKRKGKEPTESFAISDWKKCADRLLFYREVLKFLFFQAQYLRTCLKAD